MTDVTDSVGQLETEKLILEQQKASLQALYEDRERSLRECESKLLKAESVNESLFTNYNNLVEDFNQAVSVLMASVVPGVA